jgi:hypothetical protein
MKSHRIQMCIENSLVTKVTVRKELEASVKFPILLTAMLHPTHQESFTLEPNSGIAYTGKCTMRLTEVQSVLQLLMTPGYVLQ